MKDSNINSKPPSSDPSASSTSGSTDSITTASIQGQSSLEATTTKAHMSSPNARCACGCVPQIRGLFEMAELRKQMQLEKKKHQQEASR
jgi:hypothetical protein